MARPKIYDDALRTRLLDRAGELISAEGARALSLRGLAANVGTSTTAVYSLFGSKTDLVNAVFLEAFRRFGARLDAVRMTGNHPENVVRLGLAYRESALADPHLYGVMFTRDVPGFEPGEEAIRVALSTRLPLAEAVRAGVGAGVFTEAALDTMTASCWAHVHGLVTLEFGGHLADSGQDPATLFETAVWANVRGWLA